MELDAKENGLMLEAEARQQLQELARSVGAVRALAILDSTNG